MTDSESRCGDSSDSASQASQPATASSAQAVVAASVEVPWQWPPGRPSPGRTGMRRRVTLVTGSQSHSATLAVPVHWQHWHAALHWQCHCHYCTTGSSATTPPQWQWHCHWQDTGQDGQDGQAVNRRTRRPPACHTASTDEWQPAADSDSELKLPVASWQQGGPVLCTVVDQGGCGKGL